MIGHDERVVGAQQPLDQDEERHGNEIRELDVHLAGGFLDTVRINAYI